MNEDFPPWTFEKEGKRRENLINNYHIYKIIFTFSVREDCFDLDDSK